MNLGGFGRDGRERNLFTSPNLKLCRPDDNPRKQANPLAILLLLANVMKYPA
jgi:hypothetical protein